MGWLDRLFGRSAAPSVKLVMTYRNETTAPQRVVFEPLARAFLVAPNQKIEVFDRSPPDDPFIRIDNKGDAVIIYRWMTAELSVQSDGQPLEPSRPTG